MCQQAARITDPCVHGGMVISGSADTVIGAMPAARKGDAHACPIHPPGKIVSASKTVLINGVGAARRLDAIQCATPPSPPGGKGVVYDVKDENSKAKLLYFDSKLDTSDGRIVGWEGGVGLLQTELAGQKDAGPFTLGAVWKQDIGSAKAQGYQDYAGFKGEAKAAVASEEVTVYVAPKGDKYNPYYSVSASGEVLSAGAKVNNLDGYDGQRIGVVKGAQAGAGVLGGEVKGRTGIPIGKALAWFGWTSAKDITIDIQAGVSGGLGGVGSGLGAGAYYDTKEKRFHIMGFGEGEFLAGLGINLDISIGKKFEAPPPPPAPAPDAIRTGYETVFIGG
jgi:uncharacterized Zn-binding protein involved in type VI secretion